MVTQSLRPVKKRGGGGIIILFPNSLGLDLSSVSCTNEETINTSFNLAACLLEVGFPAPQCNITSLSHSLPPMSDKRRAPEGSRADNVSLATITSLAIHLTDVRTRTGIKALRLSRKPVEGLTTITEE